jgi:glutaredoxin-related protein
MSTKENTNIVCYLKTHCGWSEGIRAIMRKYDLAFEEKDIIQNPAFRWEMEQRSGQPLSPCVEVNGTMLADVSGEEVEQWMISNGVLESSDSQPDAPIDSSCTDEQHAEMERAAMEGGSPQGKIRIIE